MYKLLNEAPVDDLDEDGATAVEYGLMVALIAAVIIGAVSILGTTILPFFNIQFN